MFQDTYTSLPSKGRTAVQQLAASSSSSSGSATSDAERQAILAVVQIWLNRLSLVSGITTFFASIDSLLFSLAATATHIGEPTTDSWSATDKLCTASFAGALIFHVCSAIVAFVASFVLVRLQLIDADEQEERVLPPMRGTGTGTGTGPSRGHRPSGSLSATLSSPPRDLPNSEFPRDVTIRAVDALDSFLGRVIVQLRHPLGFVRVRRSTHQRTPSTSSAFVTETLDAPVQLLTRCHDLAIVMALLGFILGVVGILAYAWTATPLAVSVFTSACLGSCLVVSVIVMW